MNEFANLVEYGLIAVVIAVSIIAAFCLRGVWNAARKLLNKGERNAD